MFCETNSLEKQPETQGIGLLGVNTQCQHQIWCQVVSGKLNISIYRVTANTAQRDYLLNYLSQLSIVHPKQEKEKIISLLNSLSDDMKKDGKRAQGKD